MVKPDLKFSRDFIIKLIAAGTVFLLSLLILPFYTGGDQAVYRQIYAALAHLSLREGLLFYSRNLASHEFVHFFLSWIASHFIGKDLFIAFSNAILAYVSTALFLKWRTSVAIVFFIILTNFYFLGFYFAAERLKFGFIFLALSMLYVEQIKRFYGFAVAALISHASIVIIYGSILFKVFTEHALRLLRTGKISKSGLLIIPLLFLPLLLVKNQIFSKFLSYYHPRSVMELGKILIFLLLALLYAKKKSEPVILFVPLAIAVLLVGGERVNSFGYFIFLYYGLRYKGGWNFGVLATSLYFVYSSINFVVNIIQHGNGFFLK